jgi:hypothetical protein
MSKNLIAERDGVMLKIGNEIRQLYKDGAVPEGADAAHVQLLVDRGLLVEAEGPDADGDDLAAWVSDSNVEDVLDYVDKNPDVKDEVLAAEKAGKNRTGIVSKLEGS